MYFKKSEGRKRYAAFKRETKKKTNKGFLRESRSQKNKKLNLLITKNIHPSI